MDATSFTVVIDSGVSCVEANPKFSGDSVKRAGVAPVPAMKFARA